MQPQVTDEDFTTLLSRVRQLKLTGLKSLARAISVAQSGRKADVQDRIVKFLQVGRDNGDPVRALVINDMVHDVLYDKPLRSYTDLRRAYEPNGVGNSSASTSAPSSQKSTAPKRPWLFFKENPFFVLKKIVTPEAGICHRAEGRGTCSILFNLSAADLNMLKTIDSYKLFVLCGVYDKDKSTTDAYVEFPTPLEITFNKTLIKDNVKGLKNKPGTAKPANLTPYISSSNRLDFVYAFTKLDYLVFCYIVEKVPPQKILQKILASARTGKDTTVKEIIADNNDDDEIMEMSTILSLKCPVSFMRMKYPVKSIFCKHLTCFDALQYIYLQEQTTTWACPVCNNKISVKDLSLNEYLLDILKNTPETCESVEIDPNGTWHPMYENADGVLVRAENLTPKVESVDPQVEPVGLDDDIDNIQSAKRAKMEPQSGTSATPMVRSVTPSLAQNKASPIVISLDSDDDDYDADPTPVIQPPRQTSNMASDHGSQRTTKTTTAMNHSRHTVSGQSQPPVEHRDLPHGEVHVGQEQVQSYSSPQVAIRPQGPQAPATQLPFQREVRPTKYLTFSYTAPLLLDDKRHLMTVPISTLQRKLGAVMFHQYLEAIAGNPFMRDIMYVSQLQYFFLAARDHQNQEQERLDQQQNIYREEHEGQQEVSQQSQHQHQYQHQYQLRPQQQDEDPAVSGTALARNGTPVLPNADQSTEVQPQRQSPLKAANVERQNSIVPGQPLVTPSPIPDSRPVPVPTALSSTVQTQRPAANVGKSLVERQGAEQNPVEGAGPVVSTPSLDVPIPAVSSNEAVALSSSNQIVSAQITQKDTVNVEPKLVAPTLGKLDLPVPTFPELKNTQYMELQSAGSAPSPQVMSQTAPVESATPPVTSSVTPPTVAVGSTTPIATSAPKAALPTAPAPKAALQTAPAPKVVLPMAPVESAASPATSAAQVVLPMGPAPKVAIPTGPAPKVALPTGPAPKITLPTAPAPKFVLPMAPVENSASPATSSPKVALPMGPAPKVALPMGPAPKVAIPTGPAPKITFPTSRAPKVVLPTAPAHNVAFSRSPAPVVSIPTAHHPAKTVKIPKVPTQTTTLNGSPAPPRVVIPLSAPRVIGPPEAVTSPAQRETAHPVAISRSPSPSSVLQSVSMDQGQKSPSEVSSSSRGSGGTSGTSFTSSSDALRIQMSSSSSVVKPLITMSVTPSVIPETDLAPKVSIEPSPRLSGNTLGHSASPTASAVPLSASISHVVASAPDHSKAVVHQADMNTSTQAPVDLAGTAEFSRTSSVLQPIPAIDLKESSRTAGNIPGQEPQSARISSVSAPSPSSWYSNSFNGPAPRHNFGGSVYDREISGVMALKRRFDELSRGIASKTSSHVGSAYSPASQRPTLPVHTVNGRPPSSFISSHDVSKSSSESPRPTETTVTSISSVHGQTQPQLSRSVSLSSVTAAQSHLKSSLDQYTQSHNIAASRSCNINTNRGSEKALGSIQDLNKSITNGQQNRQSTASDSTGAYSTNPPYAPTSRSEVTRFQSVGANFSPSRFSAGNVPVTAPRPAPHARTEYPDGAKISLLPLPKSSVPSNAGTGATAPRPRPKSSIFLPSRRPPHTSIMDKKRASSGSTEQAAKRASVASTQAPTSGLSSNSGPADTSSDDDIPLSRVTR